MQKAMAWVQRFGVFAVKVQPEKDDLFTLRLKRLRRVQAQQDAGRAAGQLFRNRTSHLEA